VDTNGRRDSRTSKNRPQAASQAPKGHQMPASGPPQSKNFAKSRHSTPLDRMHDKVVLQPGQRNRKRPLDQWSDREKHVVFSAPATAKMGCQTETFLLVSEAILAFGFVLFCPSVSCSLIFCVFRRIPQFIDTLMTRSIRVSYPSTGIPANDVACCTASLMIMTRLALHIC